MWIGRQIVSSAGHVVELRRWYARFRMATIWPLVRMQWSPPMAFVMATVSADQTCESRPEVACISWSSNPVRIWSLPAPVCIYQLQTSPVLFAAMFRVFACKPGVRCMSDRTPVHVDAFQFSWIMSTSRATFLCMLSPVHNPACLARQDVGDDPFALLFWRTTDEESVGMRCTDGMLAIMKSSRHVDVWAMF